MTEAETFAANLPLVKHVAGKVFARYRHVAEYDDLFQVGAIGLLMAIRKYDPQRSVPFGRYASKAVANRIFRELRKAFARGHGSEIVDAPDPRADRGARAVDDRDHVEALLASVRGERMREVLAAYATGEDAADVARRLGCKKQNVSSLLCIAFARMAKQQGALRRPGERNVLSHSQVREIRDAYRKGERGRGAYVLARRYGVSAPTIRAVVRGESYQGIE